MKTLINRFWIVVGVMLCSLLGGCVLGSVQSFPAIELTCTVLDDRTGEPIRGARLFVVYDAPNPGGKNIDYGPFITGPTGVCQISIPKKTIWISGSDAFIGGYHRGLEVKADGFQDGGVYEGYNKGVLKNSGDYTFRLKPR